MVKKEEYTQRRKNLIANLEEGSAAIVFSGISRKSNADALYDFEVNRNFYYLTGIDQENSRLLIIKTNDEVKEYLFIDEKDPNVEKWLGIKLSIEEAQEISGVRNVLLTSSFDGMIDSTFEPGMTHFGLIKYVYIDLDTEIKIAPSTTTREYAEKIPVMNPSLEVKDLFPLVADLRMIKSPAEIALMRDAIRTTDVALKNVMKELHAGRFEYNMKNTFEYVVAEDLDSKLAFPSIFASGKNALILHYPNPKGILHDGDLLLCDVGARKGYYSADISRTYPINGKYSPIQKQLYNIVLECSKATTRFIKPGITLKDVHDYARDFLANECVKAGLLKDVSEIGRVYYHSCSHFIGLDTHDLGSRDKSIVLKPNMVISMEPGLYFEEYGVGIRIEDDVLIHEDGAEYLSKDIIREVDDIEKMLISK